MRTGWPLTSVRRWPGDSEDTQHAETACEHTAYPRDDAADTINVQHDKTRGFPMKNRNRLARRLGDVPQQPKRGPEAVHAGFREAAPPTDQREQRHVRQLGGSAPPCTGFDLAVEFGEQLAPLERGIAALPRPAAMRGAVLNIADAANIAVLFVAELILESPGASADAQRRASQVVADLAAQAQSEVPAVSDAMIVSATWSAPLLARSEVLADDLAALLARAHRPGAAALGGDLSIAERIEQVLRRLDGVVRDAGSHLDRVARHQSLPSPSEYNAERRAEAVLQRQRDAEYQAKLRADRRALAAAGARP